MNDAPAGWLAAPGWGVGPLRVVWWPHGHRHGGLRKLSEVLPPALQGVAWPAGVRPLGVFERPSSRGTSPGERIHEVRLQAEWPPTEEQHRALSRALVRAGLPVRPSRHLFQAVPTVFDLPGGMVLDIGTSPEGQAYVLYLMTAAQHQALFAWAETDALRLTQPAGVAWEGRADWGHRVLLPDAAAIPVAFAHWAAEAAGHGWEADPPLIGPRDALLSFHRAASVSGETRLTLLAGADPHGDQWLVRDARWP